MLVLFLAIIMLLVRFARLMLFFSLLSLFMTFFMRMILVMRSFWFKRFGNIPHCCPVLGKFFVLSSHLDKESASEYFFIELIADEVDGIDFGLEYDLKGARVVLFDFDEGEVGEGFFDIFLSCIEIALDQIEGDILNFVVEVFDLIDEVFLLGEHKGLLLFFLHHNITN